MSPALLAMPVLIPLATAVCCIIATPARRAQRLLSLLGAAALAAAGALLLRATTREGVVSASMADWRAPFGIAFAADTLGALLVLATGVVGLAVVVSSMAGIDKRRESFGFHALLHTLLMGVCGAFLTADVFNLYVWFEVMLMSSFVLLALGGERAQLEGAIKYVTLNLVSSGLFLAGAGILYGLFGTLSMADLAVRVREMEDPFLVAPGAMLLVAAFGIKAAVFPMFFWLPASYHTPPAAVSALLAALLTEVGVYSLVRTSTLIFEPLAPMLGPLFLWVMVLTLAAGLLGALAQRELRRTLSFLHVGQVSYALIGIGLMTPMALGGTVFYMTHHIVVIAGLFLAAGAVRRAAGTERLDQLGGLMSKRPLLAIATLALALSLAGMPPFSGFWGKLALVRGAMDAGAWWIAGAALAGGIVTLFVGTRLWMETFWKSPPEGRTLRRARRGRREAEIFGPVAALALLTAALGVFAGALWGLSDRAARQLLEPGAYIEAVLGGGGDGTALDGEEAGQ